MPYTRDPVSEQFDTAAAKLLRAAYKNKGKWVGTYLKNPTPQWQVWAARNGIRLLGKDTAAGGKAKTRWARAFVRAIYYLHQWHYYETRGLVLDERRTTKNHSTAIEYQVGSVRITPAGKVVGRYVRVRALPGGTTAQRAVERKPDSQRIFESGGGLGERWADQDKRDWQ